MVSVLIYCVNETNSNLLLIREAEERAQLAEQRALQTESELKNALEKIRALERAASRPSSAQSGETSVKLVLKQESPANVTPQILKSPSPRPSSRRQQSRGSAGSSTGKRKK